MYLYICSTPISFYLPESDLASCSGVLKRILAVAKVKMKLVSTRSFIIKNIYSTIVKCLIFTNLLYILNSLLEKLDLLFLHANSN